MYKLLQTAGPKAVRSDNGRPLIALRRLLLVLVSRPLRIVHCCCPGFPVSGSIGYINYFAVRHRPLRYGDPWLIKILILALRWPCRSCIIY